VKNSFDMHDAFSKGLHGLVPIISSSSSGVETSCGFNFSDSFPFSIMTGDCIVSLRTFTMGDFMRSIPNSVVDVVLAKWMYLNE